MGYSPDFLGQGFNVSLPTFSESLSPDVLTRKDMPRTYFQDGAYVQYINYSVATNTERRQPIVVALNINQSLFKSVRRGPWGTDPQVGDYQLDNSYYRNNVYDRGHLARRSSAAWGVTKEEAKAASDATMFYTNAALQHANFNQDEWLFLENWVKDLQDDATDKISVFSGPIYTSSIEKTSFIGRPPAMIPTAFFKVVVFVDKQGKLATRAFIMAQDRNAISDKNAKKRRFDLGVYQVSCKLIEEETGLVFDEKLCKSNPIIFTNPNPDAPEPMQPTPDKPVYPVIVPVDPDTVQPDKGNPPTVISRSKMAIICAMINAKGDESTNEWVTIANFGAEDVDLSGWTLSDRKRRPLPLSGTLRAGEAKRIDELAAVRLSNKSGQIVLLNPDGYIADRVTYSSQSRVIQEGVPVTFHLDEHISSDTVKDMRNDF